MALELFLVQGSPYAWRVQLALEYKNADYETRVLSMSQGDLKKPEFVAMSPRGKAPVLRDGDVVLPESLAILAYLEPRFPHRPMFGRKPEHTAAIWRQISEYVSYVDSAVEAFILPIYFGRAREEAVEIRRAVATLTGELATYERILERTPFVAGEEPTAADFVVFPHVQSVLRAASKPAAKDFGLPFMPFADRHPAIAAWLARIADTPGYDRTYPQNWR